MTLEVFCPARAGTPAHVLRLHRDQDNRIWLRVFAWSEEEAGSTHASDSRELTLEEIHRLREVAAE